MKNRMLFYLSLPIFVLGGMLFANPVCGAMTRGEPDSAAGSDQEGAPAFATFSDADSSIYGFFSAMAAQHMEKLWLHLDKPYYIAGDTVWFRAYLSDAVRHMPDTLSNFIYVDLYDRRNKLIAAKKIKRDSIGFANNLSLSDTLAAGEYTLQAYTGWMLNFSPDGFFQKNITIGKTTAAIQTSVTYPGKEMMIVRFSDLAGSPVAGNEASYELFDRNGKLISGGTQATSPSGALFVTLPPDSCLKGAYAETRLKLENNTVYKQTLFPAPQTATFDIQFLPEGGHLVPGASQCVAFKAVRSDGYPANVHGVVLSSAGDTVARFSSEHDGMGTFLLFPQPGERYRARTAYDTLSRSTTLPAVQEDACALTVVQNENHIYYRMLGTVPEKSTLVAHTRGVCRFTHRVNPEHPEGLIRTDSLQEGILHLLLVDSSGSPRTERLVYLSRPWEQWQLTPDKPAYAKREKVHILLTLEKDGKPLCGDFSVSVTDPNTLRSDSLAENIRTNLLLTSDLKGYIHQPGYYFLDRSRGRLHHLDLLMLTHGWRRFDTKNLFLPNPFVPKHYFEHGQYIAGQVKTLGNRDAKNASVTAFALNRDNMVGTAVSDSTGRFLMEGFDFQDSTVFFLSSKNKRNRIPFEVRADKLYPQPKLKLRLPYLSDEQQKSQDQDVQHYEKSFSQTHDKGAWEMEIEEVSVTAKNPNRPAIAIFTEMHEDTARFAKFGSASLEVYIKHLPNVRFYKKKDATDGLAVKLRSGSYVPAQIRVDNTIVYSPNYLHRFTVSELKNIRFILPAQVPPSFFLDPTKWPDYPCRIDIFLKEDINGTRDFTIYRTNGYAKPVEFYHPVYDTPERFADEKPDHRTTLYWNPYLHLEDGKTQLEFYSDDNEKPTYEITIEGVTPDGTVCRYQQKM